MLSYTFSVVDHFHLVDVVMIEDGNYHYEHPVRSVINSQLRLARHQYLSRDHESLKAYKPCVSCVGVHHH